MFADESVLHASTGLTVAFAVGRSAVTLPAFALPSTTPAVMVQVPAVQVCPECEKVMVPLLVTGDPLTPKSAGAFTPTEVTDAAFGAKCELSVISKKAISHINAEFRGNHLISAAPLLLSSGSLIFFLQCNM
jgi:hypothetical protein